MNTIDQIRSSRDNLLDDLKGLRKRQYQGQYFGREQEYNIDSLVGDIRSLCSDITEVLRKPTLVRRYSTHNERQKLLSNLNQVRGFTSNKDFASAAISLDGVKTSLRSLSQSGHAKTLAQSSKDQDLLAAALVATDSKKSELDEKIKQVQELIDMLNENISTSNDTLAKLDKKTETLDEKIIASSAIEDKIETRLDDTISTQETVQEVEAEVISKKLVIDNFVKRIVAREAELEKQSERSENFENQLTAFSEEQSKYLREAKSLIASSKEALGLMTSEGLSAAFMSQYSKAAKWYLSVSWLIAAAILVIFVGLLSLSILRIETDAGFAPYVARLTLIPLLIAGIWFAAGQYVKQRNIMEAYSFKSVLAKSIAGFSEQIKSRGDSDEEYSHFMRSILAQVHKDPISARSKKSKFAGNGDADEVSKFLDQVQKLSKQVEKLTSKMSN